MRDRLAELKGMISDGRLLISEKNIQVFGTDDRTDFGRLMEVKSEHADLVIRGFTEVKLEQKGPALFQRHKGLKDVLWVSAEEKIFID